MAARARLSTGERHPRLHEERRVSRSDSAPARAAPAIERADRTFGPSASFTERQEALLAKNGRANAVRNSRKVAVLSEDDGGVMADDGTSSPGSAASRHAPSLHPSAGGVSLGLSETTVGAGDDTAYWDFQHRQAEKKDLGHKCHECKRAFMRVGEAISERRGARVSMRYHAECFSGFADPRSQARSSHHEGHLAGTQMAAAPAQQTSKMRTSHHFDGGGRLASSGKLGTSMALGHSGFGARSSKGKVPQRAPGGFTEDELAAHNQHMEAIGEEPAAAE